jgi:hypothetical protein
MIAFNQSQFCPVDRYRHSCSYGNFLAGLLFLFALVWIPISWAGCANVRIEQRSPLDFGVLRIEPGVNGWAVLMAGGGLVTSPGIARSSGRPARPGVISVRAPPNTELTLTLAIPKTELSKDKFKFQNISLSVHGARLTKNGDFWVLRTHPSSSLSVELMLEMGAEISVVPVSTQLNTITKIGIECVSVRPV